MSTCIWSGHISITKHILSMWPPQLLFKLDLSIFLPIKWDPIQAVSSFPTMPPFPSAHAASPPHRCTDHSWSGCISSIKVMTGHRSCGLWWGWRGFGGRGWRWQLFWFVWNLCCHKNNRNFHPGPAPHPAHPRFGPAAKSKPLCPT